MSTDLSLWGGRRQLHLGLIRVCGKFVPKRPPDNAYIGLFRRIRFWAQTSGPEQAFVKWGQICPDPGTKEYAENSEADSSIRHQILRQWTPAPYLS